MDRDDIPEPSDEELAEMEAAFDQGDDYDYYDPDDWLGEFDIYEFDYYYDDGDE
jgi:hypothetical protein